MCKEATESRILSKRDRPRYRRAEPAAEGVFIPGINLAASVINAVIAGVIVTALGEGSIYAFEQVYLGNKDISDIDWVKKIIKSKLPEESMFIAVGAGHLVGDHGLIQQLRQAGYTVSPVK